MINAYKEKRDLYATVASTVFNNKYEDNLEFYPDGSMNYEGKERRTFCKSIILGEHTLCPSKIVWTWLLNGVYPKG